MSTGLTKQIDRGLKNYYDHKKIPYNNAEGVGKFMEWIDENGYDTEIIEEDFNQQPEETSIVEFDPEFPTDLEDNERMLYIFEVLQECRRNPAAFFQSAELPIKEERKPMTNESSDENEPNHVYHPPVPSESQQIKMAKEQSLIEYTKQMQKNGNYSKSHLEPEEDYDDLYVDQHHRDRHNDHRKDSPSKPKSKSKSAPQSKPKPLGQIATDPMYQSALITPKLDISSIKDSTLKSQYVNAMDLKKKGDKALARDNFKHALKYYSQIFIYLGMDGTRILSDFANDNPAENPLIDSNTTYIAMDKLRATAYLQIAAVYSRENKWDKAIEKCTKVIEEDETNIKAFLDRGRAYRKLKKFELAKEDLNKAKKSAFVSIEIEQELNSLRRNMDNKFSDDEDSEEEMGGISSLGGGGGFGNEQATISSFHNDNYPQLPVRDEMFEAWLKDTNLKRAKKYIPYEILYPVPSRKPQYKLYSNEEMLDMALIWLDCDVVEKIITLQIFDINKQKKIYKFATYLNQLATGRLSSGFKYEYNMDKFTRLFRFLCQNKDIDLESRDDDQRTPLANTIKYGIQDLGNILLKYGGNVNDGSVKKQIEENKMKAEWVRRNLKILRENNLNAITTITSTMYGIIDEKINTKILDFAVSSWNDDESVDDID